MPYLSGQSGNYLPGVHPSGSSPGGELMAGGGIIGLRSSLGPSKRASIYLLEDPEGTSDTGRIYKLTKTGRDTAWRAWAEGRLESWWRLAVAEAIDLARKREGTRGAIKEQAAKSRRDAAARQRLTELIEEVPVPRQPGLTPAQIGGALLLAAGAAGGTYLWKAGRRRRRGNR